VALDTGYLRRAEEEVPANHVGEWSHLHYIIGCTTVDQWLISGLCARSNDMWQGVRCQDLTLPHREHQRSWLSASEVAYCLDEFANGEAVMHTT
jgi:hypothetical protein